MRKNSCLWIFYSVVFNECFEKFWWASKEENVLVENKRYTQLEYIISIFFNRATRIH